MAEKFTKKMVPAEELREMESGVRSRVPSIPDVTHRISPGVFSPKSHKDYKISHPPYTIEGRPKKKVRM